MCEEPYLTKEQMFAVDNQTDASPAPATEEPAGRSHLQEPRAHDPRPVRPRIAGDGAVTRAASDPHPHPLTPDQLPADQDWRHSCPTCFLPIQGGRAGLTAHQRTVHNSSGDPRIPITIRIEF
jgi:hypothetical protein